MEFLYENHKGELIDLSKPPYILQELDFFDWKFGYETDGQQISCKLSNPKEYKCKVAIVCDEKMGSVEQRERQWKQAINKLYEVIIADTIANRNGKLATNNGDYLSCQIIASVKNRWVKRGTFVQCDLTILTSRPVWITEQKEEIRPISDMAAAHENEKVYPYSYPYKYPLLQTETNVYIDHYTDSDFKLTIYGPTPSVMINIAGHPYEVNYPIEEKERMIIDSRPFAKKEERLYVVHGNGEKENIFNYRGIEHSVFKKIPAGMIKIDYPRTYGVELVIYKERSEPPWKS